MNDFDIGLDLEDTGIIPVEDNSLADFKIDSLSEENIVPRKGNFLGLDISQNSAGICFYKDGIKEVYNSTLEYDISNPHAESIMRKELKADLLEVINGNVLDLVVIEDVFEGINPATTRKLYALNTAIDDLIIDGKVKCKDFVRVSNMVWKSWLSILDTEGKYKGFKDKEKVQGYLGYLNISEEGKGFQDRLDATGMLIGYFLNKKFNLNDTVVKKKSLGISISDVCFGYELESDAILDLTYGEDDDFDTYYINDTKITEKSILAYLNDDIYGLFITKNPIRIGLLASKFDLPLLGEKGYFGFWLSTRARRKYSRKLG